MANSNEFSSTLVPTMSFEEIDEILESAESAVSQETRISEIIFEVFGSNTIQDFTRPEQTRNGRAKTFHCTTCNKWYSSTGHLQRHYNSNAHTIAVRLSGKPDPAESTNTTENCSTQTWNQPQQITTQCTYFTLPSNYDAQSTVPPQNSMPQTAQTSNTEFSDSNETLDIILEIFEEHINGDTPSRINNPELADKSVQDNIPANENFDYKCLTCNKVSGNRCYLTQHNNTFHSGDKPYKCVKCGKRYRDIAACKSHIDKHGEHKEFKCTECPKSFNHKADLQRHMYSHTSVRPFSCHLCGKGFVRKDHLVKHYISHNKKRTRRS